MVKNQFRFSRISSNFSKFQKNSLFISLRECYNSIISFFHRFPYFELQKDIEYKAAKVGINVKYVNPAYTSQTCHHCGERGDRSERDFFVCTNENCICYNNRIDADWNAAVNIAKSKDFIK